MKNSLLRRLTTMSRTNRRSYVVMLFLIALSSACASLPVPLPPILQNRSLRISADFAGFEYQYEICVKKNIFGGCKETKWQKDVYDLTDPVMRQRLIDMGFVAKVREKLAP